jgi:hypothetical protein
VVLRQQVCDNIRLTYTSRQSSNQLLYICSFAMPIQFTLRADDEALRQARVLIDTIVCDTVMTTGGVVYT